MYFFPSDPFLLDFNYLINILPVQFYLIYWEIIVKQKSIIKKYIKKQKRDNLVVNQTSGDAIFSIIYKSFGAYLRYDI